MMRRRENEQEFAALEQAVAVSAPARAARVVAATSSAACERSVIVARCRRATRAFTAKSLAQQLRLCGTALLTFVVVHLAALQWVPESVAPAMPQGFWIALLLAALLLIGASPALARAASSRSRKPLTQISKIPQTTHTDLTKSTEERES